MIGLRQPVLPTLILLVLLNLLLKFILSQNWFVNRLLHSIAALLLLWRLSAWLSCVLVGCNMRACGAYICCRWCHSYIANSLILSIDVWQGNSFGILVLPWRPLINNSVILLPILKPFLLLMLILLLITGNSLNKLRHLVRLFTCP